MGLDQLQDINLSSNPISEEHNYQNRVKEMLRQVKYIDDFHVNAIEPEPAKQDYLEEAMLEYKIADEKQFILSKFAKFDCLQLNEIFCLADEALQKLPQDEKDDGLVKKKVKRHERKYEAFEKETFEVFDYGNDDGSDIDDFPDENTPKDIKKKMWRSQTNGFFKRKDSDLAPASALNRSSAYDDSDSVFRSSLKGFFTGRNKENKIDKNTFYASSNSTRETNEYSTLITNTEQAF